MKKHQANHKEIIDGNAIVCSDYTDFFQERITPNSVDLILTDPPYAISRPTGFAKVKNGVRRFAVSMDFGEWDHEQIDLPAFARQAYAALRRGGTAIVWYDVWKITHLHDALAQAGFKMLRLIVWNKTNPVPLNSKRTYLSNSREIAVIGVKTGSPTFHSEYDSGTYDNPAHDNAPCAGPQYDAIAADALAADALAADAIDTITDAIHDAAHENEDYAYPIPRHGGKRIHPTQKPLDLFQELIRKHSSPGDLIVDPFLGSGTTAVAALLEGRTFAGCDIDQAYTQAAQERVRQLMPSKTMAERFLRLAQPDDETGFSRTVGIEELKSAGLGFGNGGSWCRSDGPLAQRYNVERIKERNRIVGVKLNGYNRKPINKPIPPAIRERFAQERCVVLHTGNPQTDHKDGRRDDPRLNDVSRVTDADFQPLSRAANTAKRQHCKECRSTGMRFDARLLGYKKAQWAGDGRFMGTCVGCYWHDILRFNQEATKSWE